MKKIETSYKLDKIEEPCTVKLRRPGISIMTQTVQARVAVTVTKGHVQDNFGYASGFAHHFPPDLNFHRSYYKKTRVIASRSPWAVFARNLAFLPFSSNFFAASPPPSPPPILPPLPFLTTTGIECSAHSHLLFVPNSARVCARPCRCYTSGGKLTGNTHYIWII